MPGPTVHYDLRDWSITAYRTMRGSRLVLRPSIKSWARSLAVTFLAGLVLTGMVVAFGFPPGRPGAPTGEAQAAREAQNDRDRAAVEAAKWRAAEAFTKNMTIAEREAFMRKVEADHAAREGLSPAEEERADRIALAAAAGRGAYWAAFVLLAVVGIGVPLGLLGRKVEIHQPTDGQLVVTRRRLRASEAVYTHGDFTHLAVVVREVASRGHEVHDRFIGWLWSVTLVARADRDGVPRNVTFMVDQQDSLPTDVSKTTARVRQFIDVLEGASGLRATEPIVLRHDYDDWGHADNTPAESVDGVPPEFWEKAKAQQAAAAHKTNHASKGASFTAQDAEGSEHGWQA